MFEASGKFSLISQEFMHVLELIVSFPGQFSRPDSGEIAANFLCGLNLNKKTFN